MKINAASSVYAIERYRQIVNKDISKTKKEQPADAAEISKEALSFAEIFKSAKSAIDSEIELSSVELNSLAQQVQSDSYNVDESELADAILVSVRV